MRGEGNAHAVAHLGGWACAMPGPEWMNLLLGGEAHPLT